MLVRSDLSLNRMLRHSPTTLALPVPFVLVLLAFSSPCGLWDFSDRTVLCLVVTVSDNLQPVVFLYSRVIEVIDLNKEQ